jgi:hypothetical protein
VIVEKEKGESKDSHSITSSIASSINLEDKNPEDK